MSLQPLLDRAGTGSARLLLAGGDPLMLLNAHTRLTKAGFNGAVVVGSGAMRPETHPRLADVATVLRQQQPERVRDGIHALDLAADPIRFAAGLAAVGEADAVVGGPGVTPEALTDTAVWTRGAPSDGGAVHTVTWGLTAEHGLIAFADCTHAGSLCAESRARLAGLVARAHLAVSGEPARVAFLAGPNERDGNGDAEEAVAALARRSPSLVAEADRSVRFRGRANVLIFPCGTSAHLAARTGRALGATALLGPLLLGVLGVMATVVDDATEEELAGTAALAVLLAGGPAN